MSKAGDSSSKLNASRKRSSNAAQASISPSSKLRKGDKGSGDKVDASENIKPTAINTDVQDGEDNKSGEGEPTCKLQASEALAEDTQDLSRKDDVDSIGGEKTGRITDNREPSGDAKEVDSRPSTSEKRSDSATVVATDAITTLISGDTDKDKDEVPGSSKDASAKDVSKSGQQAEAAPADSSSSFLSRDEGEADEDAGGEDDDSFPGSLSTPSSSLSSDNDEDSECAIVSVKMAPEIRQSIAQLARAQTQLNSLEKRGARLYQRLEIKLERQRRPHLDQRSSIAQTIPGFWVTALLNHPYLSPYIDENDEDALSYMTNLEIESFNKLGYRIRFHFRRNPYFQNTVIMKELHLGMGGSPVSMSNPILWHRGQNLTGLGEVRQSARGGYQSFFSWFSDHSLPGRDNIAQILKDDLFRDPLHYYLTPLWEPRENGSATQRPQGDNNNDDGDDCVVISDSDDDESSQESQTEEGPNERKDDNAEVKGNLVTGLEDSHAAVGESSSKEAKEDEEVDVEDSGAEDNKDGDGDGSGEEGEVDGGEAGGGSKSE